MTADVIEQAEAEKFVQQFADVWTAPVTVERHDSLWAEDIVLVQPLMGKLRGREECRKAFAKLFELVPDLHAVVHRWAAGEDGAIFIEFTLQGTFGGKPLAWNAVDRFALRDGLIAERISYFDSTPLALTMAMRPRGWRRLLRTRFVPKLR